MSTNEIEIRRSLLHRFIGDGGISTETIEKVVEPLVQYVMTGEIPKEVPKELYHREK